MADDTGKKGEGTAPKAPKNVAIEKIGDSIKLITDEEIALFASSHSGEKLHTDLLLITSEKYNLNLEYLICGAQRPFHDKTADSILNDNNDFLNIHNNCSLGVMIYRANHFHSSSAQSSRDKMW